MKQANNDNEAKEEMIEIVIHSYDHESQDKVQFDEDYSLQSQSKKGISWKKVVGGLLLIGMIGCALFYQSMSKANGVIMNENGRELQMEELGKGRRQFTAALVDGQVIGEVVGGIPVTTEEELEGRPQSHSGTGGLVEGLQRRWSNWELDRIISALKWQLRRRMEQTKDVRVVVQNPDFDEAEFLVGCYWENGTSAGSKWKGKTWNVSKEYRGAVKKAVTDFLDGNSEHIQNWTELRYEGNDNDWMMKKIIEAGRDVVNKQDWVKEEQALTGTHWIFVPGEFTVVVDWKKMDASGKLFAPRTEGEIGNQQIG